MTYGEIKSKDSEEAKVRKQEKEKELLETLRNSFSDREYFVSEVKLDDEEYEDCGCIRYSFEIYSDGYKQSDSYYWKWNESMEDAVNGIKKHIDYVLQLRKEYPVYAKQNDYIQSHREYKRSCKLLDRGVIKNTELRAELCGYMKLPNTTNCSCGGGDYEFKATPKRVEDFNRNIDNLSLFLADCIGELRKMKNELKLLEEKQDEDI